jgi:hypothetical protein
MNLHNARILQAQEREILENLKVVSSVIIVPEESVIEEVATTIPQAVVPIEPVEKPIVIEAVQEETPVIKEAPVVNTEIKKTSTKKLEKNKNV